MCGLACLKHSSDIPGANMALWLRPHAGVAWSCALKSSVQLQAGDHLPSPVVMYFSDPKADVSSVSPSSERIVLFRRRANAGNASFWISLRWPIHIINPLDKTKLSCNTPHKRSATVSLETYHTYLFLWPSVSVAINCCDNVASTTYSLPEPC